MSPRTEVDMSQDDLQRPCLGVVEGGGMSADDAAWAMVADAAGNALMLPGLSRASAAELECLLTAALRCAQQQLPQSPRATRLS